MDNAVSYILTKREPGEAEVVIAESDDTKSLMTAVSWMGDYDRIAYRIAEVVMWGTGIDGGSNRVN